MSSFAKRRILITGAGSGIGRQLAHLLAVEEATLGLVDRNPEGLEALARELQGKQVGTAHADVTNVEQMRTAVRQLEEQLGPTDILIANAGIGVRTSALEFRIEDVTAQIQVNLIGVANSIDAVLAGMLQRRAGHLVILSSLASYRGLPQMAGYCASKAGVSALGDSLRVELEPQGIAVTTICPGWIRTPLTASIEVPQPHMLDVEVAARHMIATIRARKHFTAFPLRARAQVALLRWLPSPISDWMIRRMVRRLEQKK